MTLSLTGLVQGCVKGRFKRAIGRHSRTATPRFASPACRRRTVFSRLVSLEKRFEETVERQKTNQLETL